MNFHYIVNSKILFETSADSESGIDVNFSETRLISSEKVFHPIDIVQNFIFDSLKKNLLIQILLNLEAKDLTSLACVCWHMHDLIYNNKQLNDKRLKFLNNIRINKQQNFKERIITSTPNEQIIIESPNSYFKIHFPNSNILTPLPVNKSPQLSPSTRQWHKFFKLSDSLSPNEKLARCPRCSNPARIFGNVSKCTSPGCSFVHCDICWSPECQSVKYFEYVMEDNENIVNSDSDLKLIPPPPCSQTNYQNTLDYINQTKTLSDNSDSYESSIIIPESVNDDLREQRKESSKIRRLLFAAQKSVDISESFGNEMKLIINSKSLQCNSTPEISIQSPDKSSSELDRSNDVICMKSARKRLKRL